MDAKFELTIVKTPENTRSIDDKSMNNVSFQTYYYNHEKTTHSEIIFTSKNKIINNYVYGIIYIILCIILINFFETFESPTRFIEILYQVIMISGLVTFIGLIFIPFTMVKNLIFIQNASKYSIQEQSILGLKKEVLDFEKVKKVITKVDSKISYITFRSGNTLSQSIIIKVDSNKSKEINQINDFLIKFTETKYPNIEYSKI